MKDCLDLMLSGRWVTGQSHQVVATRHGVHPDTVKKWATNASRIIRLAVEGDVEDIRARMVTTLDLILARSMGLEEPIDDGGTRSWAYAPKEALAAIETQAKLLGLVVQKHEVAMTDEEAEQLIAKAKAL